MCTAGNEEGDSDSLTVGDIAFFNFSVVHIFS